jgi:hypothetical protein
MIVVMVVIVLVIRPVIASMTGLPPNHIITCPDGQAL